MLVSSADELAVEEDRDVDRASVHVSDTKEILHRPVDGPCVGRHLLRVGVVLQDVVFTLIL
jgi:hypothetical protein